MIIILQPIAQAFRKFPGSIGLLSPIRQWLKNLEIGNVQIARLLAKIPATCSLAREIRFLNYVFYIPPLCHLNPLYDELMELRLRALAFLAQISENNLLES